MLSNKSAPLKPPPTNPIDLADLFPWFDRVNTAALNRPKTQETMQALADGISFCGGFAGVAAAALISIAFDVRAIRTASSPSSSK